MLARRILVVALAVLSPFCRLPAQFATPGPVIEFSFLSYAPFPVNCPRIYFAYSASCTVQNAVGDNETAIAAITPGPAISVFSLADGSAAPNDYIDVESRATLTEEIRFTGANPDDIFSFAVSGSLQWTQSSSFGSIFSFMHLQLGAVDGGIFQTRVGSSWGMPDDTFTLVMDAKNSFNEVPDAFFFTLQSESIVASLNGGTTSSFVNPFVTFYDETGNDITGNYTLSYIPSTDVVATPEPATFATTLTGLLGVAGFVSRRRRKLQTLS